MLKIFKPIIALILLIALSNPSKGESIKKLKYGKVTLEELQMNEYDLDTAAEAVVLYEYAEFIPERYIFVQHLRIKVLKKTATDIASMVFDGKIKNFIKGCTYNLENGEIVKTKLKTESIFEERVIADNYRTRIAMPNVKQGSVFEVEVMQESLPSSFEIQRSIPVVYGAVLFPDHPDINIRITEIGYLGYAFRGENTWIVKDMPAFKDEPYIISENDYRVRMEFEPISYLFTRNNRIYTDNFATSWEAVVKKFNESDYCGKKINELSLFLNGLADSIKQKSKNEEELVKNAFEAIKKIHWNNNASCYVSQELKKTFQQKEGNSADININLINLLKKLDIKCYPVLFSTRKNGRVSKFAPTLHKFNYLIVAVDLTTGTKYLDATDEFVPFGLVPDRLAGCLGLPLNNFKPDCSILIQPSQKDKKISISTLTVDSTGNIKGKIFIQRLDYNAVDFKNYLKEQTDHDAYIQDLEANNSGWMVDSYKFNNLNDPYQDFTSEYDVSYSTSIGTNDVFVFNPLAFVKMNSNPFIKEKRSLPISFYEPIDYSSTVTIAIPKNYSISEIPKGIDISNNDKTARFTYSIRNLGQSIEVKTKFNINKVKYETIEYNGLRNLYETMLQKLTESIILKKI